MKEEIQKTNYCNHETTNETGICNDCLGIDPPNQHTNLRSICEKCKVPFCPDCWKNCPTCEPKVEVAKVFPNYHTLPIDRKKDFLELIIKWANEELLSTPPQQ